MNQLQIFENYVFLYVCKGKMFNLVDDDFFKNQIIQRLYKITQVFYKKFQELPFVIGDDSIEQIHEIIKRNPRAAILNRDMTEEQNISTFLIGCKAVLQTNLDKYSQKYLEDTCHAWIMWENQQKGLRDAIEWQRGQEITPENVMSVIQKSKDMINRRSSVSIKGGNWKSFFDPEAHKQTPPDQLFNSGFQNLNLFLSGKKSGGFEAGTTTLLLAHPNVGKSMIKAIWGTNLMLNGVNVYIASLEMSEAKLFKRMGSNVFNVPVNEYFDFSQNVQFVQERIRKFKEENNTEFIPHGELLVERFAEATPQDIVAAALKAEETLGIKFGVIIIDYFTELKNAYGLTRDESYSMHIDNMNELFSAGVTHKWSIITSHQLKPESSGSEDITEQMISECKGLLFRPDNVYGVVRSPSCMQANVMFLKMIKSRDSEYKYHYLKYKTDFNYMRLIEEPDIIAPGGALIY